MVSALTKRDYQRLHAHLGRLLPPGGRPLNAEEILEVGSLQSKIREVIEATRPVVEKGELVLSWRIPRELALTGNAYAGSRGWKKHKDRKLLDGILRELLPAFPKAPLHGAHKRRWIRGTRFSTQKVDECAIDLIGGKLAIDALKRASVIHDDSMAFLIREAMQAKAKRGDTHLLIEVFEITSEGDDVAEPKNVPIAQLRREPAPMTRAILEGGTHG
jgi:hypothetical protein